MGFLFVSVALTRNNFFCNFFFPYLFRTDIDIDLREHFAKKCGCFYLKVHSQVSDNFWRLKAL